MCNSTKKTGTAKKVFAKGIAKSERWGTTGFLIEKFYAGAEPLL
jgi:hypothetical protein